MHKTRVFIAIILLVLAFPTWRFLDFPVFLWPRSSFYALALTFWALIFLAWPFRLLKPGLPKRWTLIGLSLIVMPAFFVNPLSSKGTLHPEQGHCGVYTYTGVMFRFHSLLSRAHQDDLEIRNQFCWIRKMSLKVPSSLNEDEFDHYRALLEKKLLTPANKYRASLPLIAWLYGNFTASLDAGGNPYKRMMGGKTFLDSLHFWKDHYTLQISKTDYPWWDWPHSSWIKFEYGLIENNWEVLVEGLEI